MTQAIKRPRARAIAPYEGLSQIDGRHELQDLLPDFCVAYQARLRPGGRVTYFNFDLAREMGLIDAKHPTEMNAELSQTLLSTFGLIIINEWDLEHKRRFDPKTVKKHKYMATRYLQLQHPSKQGRTSGDGRSIWNGRFKHRGVTWDLSSCGTGATCLSPASVQQGRYFRSGDPSISYGCGMADLSDGVAAALMSEIFHRGGVPTERTLAVLQFPGSQAIYVRAARNLLRPAHFFRYLKQGQLEPLRLLSRHFIDRQVANGDWQIPAKTSPYQFFLDRMSHDFARSAALFEREYIFCWLDWDGDNVLTSEAAILDYGSIRQFGLFHKDYRYDDVERWSTKLLEQKGKARYLVQTFAQMVDFLETGRKGSLRSYANSQALRDFDAHFETYKKYFLLRRLGLEDNLCHRLIAEHRQELDAFEKLYEGFERQQSARGVHKVEDGVSSDAIFCMSDLLRELPKLYLADPEPLPEAEFVDIARSSYANSKDLISTPARVRAVRDFQELYLSLVQNAARLSRRSLHRQLLEITMRSSLINRYDRITGNGVLRVTDALLKERAHPQRLAGLIRQFIERQTGASTSQTACEPAQKRRLLNLVRIVEESREEI